MHKAIIMGIRVQIKKIKNDIEKERKKEKGKVKREREKKVNG